MELTKSEVERISNRAVFRAYSYMGRWVNFVNFRKGIAITGFYDRSGDLKAKSSHRRLKRNLLAINIIA